MSEAVENTDTLNGKMEDPSSRPCPHCDKIFKKLYRLTRHIYREHIKPTCTACSNSFARMKELKEHALDSHEVKMNKLCSICKKAYTSRKDLEEHLQKEHPEEKHLICTKCPRMFSDEDRLKSHIMTHKRGGTFQCMECSMSFSAPFRLARHRRVSHGDSKTIQCPGCGEHITVDEELSKRICQLHMQDTKPNNDVERKKSFSCKYCEKPFARPRDMNVHIRAEHVDQRPFKCDQCSFIFENEAQVQRHVMRRHTVKKFGCEVCHRRFWQEHTLQKHVSSMHGVKDDQNMGEESEASDQLPSDDAKPSEVQN